MPSTLYIPVMSDNVTDENFDEYVLMFRKMQANNVFLAIDRKYFFSGDRAAQLEKVSRNLRRFEEEGFEAGVWVQAFGFGNPLSNEALRKSEKYTGLKSVLGVECVGRDAFCPANPYFAEDYCRFIRDIASVHPKRIMLDDDLCMSVRPGLGCFCERHMALLQNKLGETLAFGELPARIFTGGKNRYRDAWLSVMHDTLAEFCGKIRNTVDEVSKDIRVGLCAGYTSWDIEGADVTELSRILAGNTKPFFRFTGAPYWVSRDLLRFGGQRLNTVIECARMQEKWCRDDGMEVFTEADSSPRPRFHVPANYLETFCLALHTYDGLGTLKYVCDYYSSVRYERGYLNASLGNRHLYDFIAEHFRSKAFCGVRLIEAQRRIENAVLPERFDGESKVMNRFFSPAAALLTSHGIPVTYDEGACAAVFGDNALYLDKLPEKLILDLPAAMILRQKGFDTGIKSVSEAPSPVFELYPDERVCLYNADGTYYRCETDGDTEVLSEFETADGVRYPAVLHCRKNGCEMLIFAFDAYSVNQSSDVFLSYCRQRQLLGLIGAVPYMTDCPGLYQILKKDGHETAILMQNLFEDPIVNGELILDDEYASAKIMGADGELIKDRIRFTSVIHPYDTVAVMLTK